MSEDGSLNLLKPLIQRCNTSALWVVGEQTSDYISNPNPFVKAISNRIDVVRQLTKLGWLAQFSDFDFNTVEPSSIESIFVRVVKERPVMHHIINKSVDCLTKGGRLYLTGTKQQGIKTYAKNAGYRLNGNIEINKHGNHYLAVVQRGISSNPETLEDKSYTHLRPVVNEGDLSFYSKPGLFGWDKIDVGSTFLVQHLEQFTQRRVINTILDLGCGFGYLSVHAGLYYWPAQIFATDNNAAAISACRANLALQNINAEVIVDDCASTLTGPFDLLLCNPPFHKGFDVERNFTGYFVETAARLLAPTGIAAFVVNSFIPIEILGKKFFNCVEVISDNRSFKLLRMTKPKK